MLNLDTQNTNSNTSFRSLLAFKPRQVLLAHRNPTKTMTASASIDENNTKMSLKLKGNLHEVILDYLHRNGFSKTLKRFKSEAQIQTDTWKASLLHLEDMFCKHNACDADNNKSNSNKPVLGNIEAMEKENSCPTNAETTTKKKKRKVIVEVDNELETQPKKRKTKHDLVSTDDATNVLKLDDLTTKIKDKKRKSIEKVELEPPTTKGNELITQKEKKKKKKSSIDENEIVQLDVIKKEKKDSKKRKRSFSDENTNENENLSTVMIISEESKRQKIESVKVKKSIKEKLIAQEIDKQFVGETDVKSMKKQRNVTMEPTTVNAFQRVKVDEVEFAHDKLQDNSYWAKGGAEIGYGAKAQEVLGQVRGRDFRHEKTKKKRGSYRGGLIDQQSHSIKFTYHSDDEE